MSVEIREELFNEYSSLFDDMDERVGEALFEDMWFWRAKEDCKSLMDFVLLCDDLFGGREGLPTYTNEMGWPRLFRLKCGLEMWVYTFQGGIQSVSVRIYVNPAKYNGKLFRAISYINSNCPFECYVSVRSFGAWSTSL